MADWPDHLSGDMVGKKGIPLRSWKSVKKKYGKAAGTNKVKAMLRRLDKEAATS